MACLENSPECTLRERTGFVLSVFDGKGEPGANCPSYDGARQEADEARPHQHRGPLTGTSHQPKTVLPRCCLQKNQMGMGEEDMEMVNIYDLTMLQHAWVQSGRCQKTIRLKQRFPPELDFPQHRTHGGRGDRFQKITIRCVGPRDLQRTRKP